MWGVHRASVLLCPVASALAKVPLELRARECHRANHVSRVVTVPRVQQAPVKTRDAPPHQMAIRRGTDTRTPYVQTRYGASVRPSTPHGTKRAPEYYKSPPTQMWANEAKRKRVAVETWPSSSSESSPWKRAAAVPSMRVPLRARCLLSRKHLGDEPPRGNCRGRNAAGHRYMQLY